MLIRRSHIPLEDVKVLRIAYNMTTSPYIVVSSLTKRIRQYMEQCAIVKIPPMASLCGL
jgi:hypothetical protein